MQCIAKIVPSVHPMEISLFRFSLFVIQRWNDILHALLDRTFLQKIVSMADSKRRTILPLPFFRLFGK